MRPVGQRSLTERMKGAALLKIDVYEEVEADPTATQQAAIVVGIAALAAAIGGAGAGAGGFLSGIIATYLGWLLWSGLTYLIGDKLLGGTATWGELLRTIGFAQAPRVLLLFAFIPALGPLIALVVAVWLLITGVIAIRQALDFSTGKAILTAVLGWIAAVMVGVVLGWFARAAGPF
ncbi:MAG TPA: YIP1 family protein [Longimicrobiales bacterium]